MKRKHENFFFGLPGCSCPQLKFLFFGICKSDAHFAIFFKNGEHCANIIGV